MSLIQVAVLALIQGLTEFLPVSSSAHLILGSKVFGWPDQGLVFDVATHLGTLLAALVYFRKDLWQMVVPWLDKGKGDEASRKLGVTLLIASIPAIVAGGLLYGWIESMLRDIRIIAYATIGYGLLLWWADARFARSKVMDDMNLKAGVVIGLAQMLALVPGTSRSGITITVGRMLGFNTDTAARFSFLLSIPVIAAAGGYGMLRMFLNESSINWMQFGLAVLISAIAGWLFIAAFLALLQRIGLVPFVIYRLVLGAALLWLVF
ncbi:MAG: undecaprenyl-diphosphate phosphatase [Gammaproteobacteria bacterium]|nr:MAG: undecaprenyl-diphosphate phosphatase [Gammaproteobacteria bacterium]